MAQIILFIPNTVLGSTLPVGANLFSHGDFAALSKLVQTSLKLNASIVLIAATATILFAPKIMAAYGSQFAASGIVLVILALVCVVDSATNVFACRLIGTNRLGTHLGLLVCWAFALVLASFLLVPRAGGKGLARAYLFAQSIMLWF